MQAMFRRIYKWACLRWAIRRNVVHAPDLSVGIGCIITAPDRLEIGRKVVMGTHCLVIANGSIGDGVLISSHVGIVGRRDHDASVKGVLMSDTPWIYAPDARARNADDAVIIEDDVWIGFGAIILSGVRIGRGAIIAAGAVVVKNVAPCDVVAGNPARQVSRRFSPQDQIEHEALLDQGPRGR